MLETEVLTISNLNNILPLTHEKKHHLENGREDYQKCQSQSHLRKYNTF